MVFLYLMFSKLGTQLYDPARIMHLRCAVLRQAFKALPDRLEGSRDDPS